MSFGREFSSFGYRGRSYSRGEVPRTRKRGLTDIEKALVEDFNQIILEEWCKQWDSTMRLSPSIIGTESSGKFLQTSPADAMMLILNMEASFGDVSGPMRIAVPYYTLEPVVSRLLSMASAKDDKKSVPLRWHGVMMRFQSMYPPSGMHSSLP